MLLSSLIALGAATVVFALSLVTCACITRKKLNLDPDLPNIQLKALKKNTADFLIDYKDLTFGALLGKGSQGEVYRGTWRGSEYAVKKVDTRAVQPEIIEEFCQEAEIMRTLRHPSLTLFVGVSLKDPNLCIVTELVSRGSLFDIVHDETSPLTFQRSLNIALDVARGVTYLHEHNPPILHRDLKSLNILVDESWRGKIADFGMARFEDSGNTMTQCGSPLWMAPEMIKNEPYDEKSDVYSFGVCLWEMYTRKIPYRSLVLSASQLVVKVVKEHLRPGIPKSCPKPFAKLMEKCWHPIPEHRPTFRQVVSVLESFTKDPAMMNHKPNSTRKVLVASPTKSTNENNEKNPSNYVAKLYGKLGKNDWKFDAKQVEVTKQQVLGRIRSDSYSIPLRRADEAVFKGTFRANSAAVKICSIDQKFSNDEVWKVLESMAQLRHPNLVLFMGAYCSPGKVGVLTEEMPLGSIYNMLEEQSAALAWNSLMQMLIDGAQALTYLHGNSPPIIHQDLNAHRFMVDKNLRVKLADYCFVDLNMKMHAKISREPQYHPPSACWAPEDFTPNSRPTQASNAYSFGLFMWQMIARKPLFDGEVLTRELAEEISRGRRPAFPKSTSPELKKLIEGCWKLNPKKRPSFSEIVKRLQSIRDCGPPPITLQLGVNAKRFRKAKTVFAYKTKDPITIKKDWGKNDDVYCVDSTVFDSTYEPVGPASHNEYRKGGYVVARQMDEPFSIKSSGGVEHGVAGDYLLANDMGDQWSVDASTFNELYTIAEDQTPVRRVKRLLQRGSSGSQHAQGLRQTSSSTKHNKVYPF